MNPTSLLTADEVNEMTSVVPDFWGRLPLDIQEAIRNAYARETDSEEQNLLKLSTISGTNDANEARTLRTTFRDEVVTPLLAWYQEHATEPGRNLLSQQQVTTGYLVSVASLQQVLATFSANTDVQICFGLNKGIREGGQLQLVLRGEGGDTVPAYVYTTGLPSDVNGPDGVRIKPCNASTNPPC
ncbi:hypothetical protein ACAW74_16870 [Fibrella sp. WM1]|uniref:hypothetical protein n=1 Tax=Fibrella musci TaxID=3242485 RepID=UPI00351FB158